jgi:hypothetical protein
MFSSVGGEILSPLKTFMGTKGRSFSTGGNNVGFGVGVYEYDYKHDLSTLGQYGQLVCFGHKEQ